MAELDDDQIDVHPTLQGPLQGYKAVTWALGLRTHFLTPNARLVLLALAHRAVLDDYEGMVIPHDLAEQLGMDAVVIWDCLLLLNRIDLIEPRPPGYRLVGVE